MKAEKLDAGTQADAFRERIVQASIELIREQGLGALSMREVARRAGVSHQAPYHYFADREAILCAIAEQGFGMLRDRVLAVNADHSQVLLDRIVAAGVAYITFAFEHREYFQVMFRPELVAMERHPGLKEAGDRACGIFYDVVRQAVEEGMPADTSVDALFLLCWSIGHGLACLVIDGPLDVVMPHQNREGQMHEVLATFARLMEARIREEARAREVTSSGKARSAIVRARKKK